MSQVRIRLYIAISLDGFIADKTGGVDWLRPYESEDVGFNAFLSEISTVVTGRRTYDQARGFGQWPYAGKRVIVLTHRPLESDRPAGVESYAGDIDALSAQLKRERDGDVWLLGGAMVAQEFLDRGLVDRIELYLIPVLLGDGVRLFTRLDRSRTLAFSDARSYSNGIVGLIYELGPKLRTV
jgi:dihydrofolate reductase